MLAAIKSVGYQRRSRSSRAGTLGSAWTWWPVANPGTTQRHVLGFQRRAALAQGRLAVHRSDVRGGKPGVDQRFGRPGVRPFINYAEGYYRVAADAPESGPI